ncbi:MAG: hypothetical protein V1708_01020 [Candidatus Micrarchaeota archaeon]
MFSMVLDKPGRFVRLMVDTAVSSFSEPVNYFGKRAMNSFQPVATKQGLYSNRAI